MAAEFVGPPPPHRRGALQAKQNGHFAALGSAVDTSSMPGTSFRTLHATVNCRSSCWRERKLIIERVRAGRRHARLWGRTYPGPASTVFSATRPAPRQNGRGSRLNPARSSTTPTTASCAVTKALGKTAFGSRKNQWPDLPDPALPNKCVFREHHRRCIISSAPDEASPSTLRRAIRSIERRTWPGTSW
jgi:hypothetical protein